MNASGFRSLLTAGTEWWAHWGHMEDSVRKGVPAAHNLSNPRQAKRNVKRSLGTERHATATRGTLAGG